MSDEQLEQVKQIHLQIQALEKLVKNILRKELQR